MGEEVREKMKKKIGHENKSEKDREYLKEKYKWEMDRVTKWEGESKKKVGEFSKKIEKNREFTFWKFGIPKFCIITSNL